MKYIFLALILSIATRCAAQATDEELTLINVSDTVLQNRVMIVPDPFDPQQILRKLFPGKYYDLSTAKYTNKLINWSCKTCKPKDYPDVNEEGPASFPFNEGVATRLINVIDFKDSTGIEYKVLNFNHSVFDPDGAMTSRFTGGLLGMAKFARTAAGWKLRIFQPAIAAYGAFSSCPSPKPLLIGQDQYGFIIRHFNGPGGGPFYASYYLIAGAGGSYQQMMATEWVEKSANGDPESSSWSAKYQVLPGTKKYFRDILITIDGIYKASDLDDLPPVVKAKLVKGKKLGKFQVVQLYRYKAGKGYELQPAPKVTVN